MRKTIGSILATATLTAAAILAPVGTAQAAPTGCTKGGGGTYATAKCAGGTGYYYAYAVCMNPTIPGATFYKYVEGPKRKARSGQTSKVWCPLFYVVSSRGVGLTN